MNEGVITAILALISTSLLVRVLPVACDFQFPEKFLRWMETIIPTAVFLNFLLYILLQEMRITIIASLFSLGITAILAYLDRGGLFVAVLAGCISYYLFTVVLV